MSESNNDLSRSKKQQRKRQDRILNLLIAAVIIGIIVVGTVILKKPTESPNDTEAENKTAETTDETEEEQTDSKENERGDDESAEPEDDAKEDEESAEEGIQEQESDDPVVDKTITDPNWKPIGTKQQGEHVSLYDGSSADWYEKIDALYYATGLTANNAKIVWLKNGGAPDKAIGIVSSIDESEKYRVYLEWIDGEGWKPSSVDVLNTLQFDYK